MINKRIIKLVLLSNLLLFSQNLYAYSIGELADRYCQSNHCSQTDLVADFVERAEPGICLVVTDDLEEKEFNRFLSTRNAWWLITSRHINSQQKNLAIDFTRAFYKATRGMNGKTVYWAEPFTSSFDTAIEDYCIRSFYLTRYGSQKGKPVALLIPKSN